MFESFYGLTANPFRMSADEQFRFVHKAYKKAWAYLKYALEKGEGFVLITGRPGTGKTTLIRDTLAELDSERVEPVNLVSNQLQGEELLRLVALELGLQAQDFDKATLLTRIEQHTLMLHQQQRRVVVIVDEAQNLTPHGLEELRLLSNLQAGNKPLFQILLIGQEELRSLIYGQALENIMQRIVASCILEPMSADYVQGYVEHRLGIVGWDADPTFDPALFEPLHRITHGVPRDINLVMARLLLFGALEEKHQLSKDDLITVLKELGAEQRLAVEQVALIDELSEATAETAEAPLSSEERTSETEEAVQESAENTQQEKLTPVAESTESFQVSAEPMEAVLAEAEAETAENLMQPESAQSLPSFSTEETQWEKPQQPENAVDLNLELDTSEPDTSAFFASPEDAHSEWADTEPVGEEKQKSTPQSPLNDSEMTSTGEESAAEGLPEIHVSPEGDEYKHLGLLTDADELLGSPQQYEATDSSVWRWFFYPIAIALLVLAILVVRYPDEADLLWMDFQQQLGHYSQEFLSEARQASEDSDQERVKEDSDEVPTAAPPANESQSAELSSKPVAVSSDESRTIEPKPEPDPVQVTKPESKPKLKPKAESAPQRTASQQSRQEPATPNYLLTIDQASDGLAGQSQPVFATLLQRLRAEPTLFVVLTGVSESRVGSLNGMRNALKQAVLVSDLLVKEGIAQSRIAVEGRSSRENGRSDTVEVKLRP